MLKTRNVEQLFSITIVTHVFCRNLSQTKYWFFLDN